MAAGTDRGQKSSGLAVDESGGPVIDPTENVIALTEAANKRQDDLRILTKELNDTKIAHQKEISDIREGHQDTLGGIRERHQEALNKAESARLDSIRQVDREDVNKTAAQALTAIATLASTTTTTAETLRTQVATTAQAQANALANTMGEVNKRLSALELSSSEGRGKQTVVDPMQAEMAAKMERVLNAIATGGGQSAGQKNIIAYIATGASILIALLYLADRFGK